MEREASRERGKLRSDVGGNEDEHQIPSQHSTEECGADPKGKHDTTTLFVDLNKVPKMHEIDLLLVSIAFFFHIFAPLLPFLFFFSFVSPLVLFCVFEIIHSLFTQFPKPGEH
jgi:hypothetical protein